MSKDNIPKPKITPVVKTPGDKIENSQIPRSQNPPPPPPPPPLPKKD